MSKPIAAALRLLLILGCSVLLVFPAAAATPEPVTSLTAARVYLAPDPDSLPIGLLPDGQAVEVLARLGTYYRIDCYGQTGYVQAEQIAHPSLSEYYVNCSSHADDTVTIPTFHTLELEQLRLRVLKRAYAQLGDIYVYGGQSPGGFDCSGLMQYVFSRSGFYIPRTADPQLASGLIVDPEFMLPGDLVFFNAPETSSEFITHVGLYVGDGSFLHAGVSGGVCIRSLETGYFASHLVGARRILLPGSFTVSAYHYVTLN